MVKTSEQSAQDAVGRPRPGPEWKPIALVLGLPLLLWLPRLEGPIDVRWDAGVYYVLGTSLAEGTGYRLLNEPGRIAAVQYPPLLPAIVALHQKALGTTDPLVVGRALRFFYLTLSLLYAWAVYALARRFVPTPHACAVAAITALYVHTFFLSDLVFTEVPFGLVTVAFLLLRDKEGRGSAALSAALAVAAYLLRTIGIALLAAWVAESLLERHFRRAAARAAIAILPVLAWQHYVAGVVSGPEYREPAYAYQRAPYQHYNVTYAENLRLVDSFRPEKGTLSATGLLWRVTGNVASLAVRLGEGTCVGSLFWDGWSRTIDRWLGRGGLPSWLKAVPSAMLSALVLPGLVLLARRGERLVPIYLLATLGLICVTPWPAEFPRYLTPLTPLLGICLVQCLLFIRARGGAQGALFGRVVLVCVFTCQLDAVYSAYRFDHQKAEWNGRVVGRFFFYGEPDRSFDAALDWLRSHARPHEIVATSTPQYAYLRTGLQAVMPPMEADVVEAQRLLVSVPVRYVVVDDLEWPETARRYAGPVMRSRPDVWREVYSAPNGGLRVYRRAD